MALSSGTRLGGYELVAMIGAGGMGEVYRARDHKLGRDVAIKILPDRYATDPDRMMRFEREARTLAALSHPNVAQIYGHEQFSGTAALILEFVDGDTLADRIRRGPIEIVEAVQIGKQICAALAVAHDHGIIHRDLKPANIKLRRDGNVKVLDFGLAKLSGDDVATGDATTTSPATLQGSILGTPAYMSPEQARGRAVDRRTDLWAFGCVLFEMLSGKPAFEGASITDVLAAVIGIDPDWTRLPRTTPTPIRRLLHRCLEKDSSRRLRDASDAALDLDEHNDTVKTPATAARWPSIALGAAAAAMVIGSVLGAASLLAPADNQTRPVARFSIALPDVHRLGDSRFSLSPDGTRIAYTAATGSNRILYIRDLAADQPRMISNLAGPVEPFFSPDGASVAVQAGGQLFRVDANSGVSQPVCAAQGNFQGGAWTPDGAEIIFAQSGRIFRVPAAGGSPAQIVGSPGLDARFPSVLPDGKLLYTEFDLKVGGPGAIVVHDLAGERRDVVEKGDDARYLPTGDLAIVSDSTLFVVPFDYKTTRITGPPVQVLQGVQQTLTRGAMLSVSKASQLVYARGRGGSRRRLVSVDRNGVITALDVAPRDLQAPRISPDGRKILFEDLTLPHSLWIFEQATGVLSKVAPPDNRHNAVWSADGLRILFNAMRTGDTGAAVYSLMANGSGREERIVTSSAGRSLAPLSWSPDGRLLAFSELIGNDRNIWIASTSKGEEARPILNSPALESQGAVSPNGRWIAFVSNTSGREEVYVRSFPEEGEFVQVSTAGGSQPVWARSGRELFYREADGLTAIEVGAGSSFTLNRRRSLLKIAFASELRNFITDYDVFPDGNSFIMVEDLNTAGSAQLHFITEWFDDLKRARSAARP